MRTQRRPQKISTAISLVGLAMGFSVLGLLIVAKEHDCGASIIGGILGILLGVAFLIAACLHWKCCDQIQGGFQKRFRQLDQKGTPHERAVLSELSVTRLDVLNFELGDDALLDFRLAVGVMKD